jgi:uncharacterized protein (DUF2336 family)
MLHNSGPASRVDGDRDRQSLIDELEIAVEGRDIASRVDVLRRITDLFVAGSERYDTEQRALFDDVMGRLVEEIESSARAAFGARIAAISNAPTGISRRLALDDLIEVAGPLLEHSDQLDDATLIVGAKTKSQDHLLAISQRKSLSENVTDVLVDRGEQKVVVSTAANGGARFSECGFGRLVARSQDNAELAVTVWSRPDTPREHLLALFAKASEAVRRKLESADRGKAAVLGEMVKCASDQIQSQARERSREFAEAEAEVKRLRQAGALTEDWLRLFAAAGSFDRTVLTLSFLSGLPVGAIERILVHDHSDQILLLAKSIALDRQTTRAILLLQAGVRGGSTEALEECLARFDRLKPATARTAIQFYRLRERSAGAAKPR